MPRAHRNFLSGHIWHITHRCHKKEFLLKFARDRDRWRYWLYQAKKRYGLCVLNYIVTSNHVHLLVHDQGKGEIARSMQLIAGRTAQEYNLRKGRKGAYWDDRYHATAIETGDHLARCITYIDRNMVRAGVVRHPEEWIWSGYYEIQYPLERYMVIDINRLLELNDMKSEDHYRDFRKTCVDNDFHTCDLKRNPEWSNSLAVGSSLYIDTVRAALGISSCDRRKEKEDGGYVLREPSSSYITLFEC